MDRLNTCEYGGNYGWFLKTWKHIKMLRIVYL